MAAAGRILAAVKAAADARNHRVAEVVLGVGRRRARCAKWRTDVWSRRWRYKEFCGVCVACTLSSWWRQSDAT